MKELDRVVEVENLSISYSDAGVVLKDVSFLLKKNEHLGIIGPNGAGKTSLALAICGLIKYTGTVSIMNNILTQNNQVELRKHISVVFQNPDDQLFMPIVYEDIAFGLEQFGHSNEEIENIVKESLEAVHMQGFENRNSHHLSVGQKKRICLAAALARNASIMILDEPTNELDPGGKKEFLALLKKIKCAKIIVSHDMNRVLEICDKVIILNNNEIVAQGEAREILADQKKMEENGLEVPYGLLP